MWSIYFRNLRGPEVLVGKGVVGFRGPYFVAFAGGGGIMAKLTP